MTLANLKGYPRLTGAEDLLRRGLHDQASFIVIQHLREHRDEPRGLALLGEIALASGAFSQAEQFLSRAIALGCGGYAVERNLASSVLRQDRLGDALELFTALEGRFDAIELSATRAVILDRLGRTEQALAAHQRVIADPRADAGHWIVFGHSLRFAGRTDEAISTFRHVIEEDPERGEAWWGIADIKSKVLTDDDLQLMQSTLADAVDTVNVVPLHMALGRGLHDREEYEQAFRHYQEGNRLRADLYRYDPRELSHEVDQFIGMVRTASIPAQSKPGEPIPVFLVSLPRSGSTLVEQILSRHPQIEATGELPYIRSIMRGSLEMHMRHGPITVPHYLARLSAGEKEALGAEYLRRAADHLQTEAPFFVDKMPSNWSDILFIREILPQARFVEIRRNAMDCCFSNYVHHFGSAHAASFDLLSQARAYLDYSRLMDHLTRVAPRMICSVQYEELVDQPERELRLVLDYLGLDWNDDLLSFYESDRTVRTPSAEQVRRPLNRSSIGAWKPYALWLEPLRLGLGPLAAVY